MNLSSSFVAEPKSGLLPSRSTTAWLKASGLNPPPEKTNLLNFSSQRNSLAPTAAIKSPLFTFKKDIESSKNHTSLRRTSAHEKVRGPSKPKLSARHMEAQSQKRLGLSSKLGQKRDSLRPNYTNKYTEMFNNLQNNIKLVQLGTHTDSESPAPPERRSMNSVATFGQNSEAPRERSIGKQATSPLFC